MGHTYMYQPAFNCAVEEAELRIKGKASDERSCEGASLLMILLYVWFP